MSGWFARNKKTVEIDVALLAGIAIFVAGMFAFIVSRHTGNDSSAANAHALNVMPGHGQTMPNTVRVANRPGVLSVAIGDFWFKPGTHRVRAGRYRFTAHNYGTSAHDIMLTPAGKIKFESAGQPSDIAQFGLDNMYPGLTRTTTVMLTPGRWEWFCSAPGHYLAGQHATLQVVGPMPKGLMPTNSSPMGSSPMG